MQSTKIEWADATWNCVTGCTRVSDGCNSCYAASMSKRLAAMGQVKYQGIVGNGHFNGAVKTWDDELSKPLKWKKPKMIFVNSMSDTFHKDVPFEFIAKIFAVAALAERHTFQILTKRPERAVEFFEWCKEQWPKLFPFGVPDYDMESNVVLQFLSDDEAGCQVSSEIDPPPWPLPNVWLGTSVEDQQRADERAEHLRRCPAAVRFYSVEPLLGPIGRLPLDGIQWCIVGGESGHNARPCDLSWIRSIVQQCEWSGVPYFVKQLGASVYDSDCDDIGMFDGSCGHGMGMQDGKHYLRLKHSKGGNIEEFPDDLKRRQFPTTAVPQAER